MSYKSSTEWLFEKLWDTPKDKFTWYALLKQAQEMEREQKCDFAYCYADNVTAGFNETPEYYLEEYETFKDKK